MALAIDDVNKSCPTWCYGRAKRGVLADPKHKCTACANRARLWHQYNNPDMRPEAVVFAIPGSKLTDAVTVDSREKDKNPEKFASRGMYAAARRGHAPGVDFWLRTSAKEGHKVKEVVNSKHFQQATPLHVSAYRVRRVRFDLLLLGLTHLLIDFSCAGPLSSS